MTYLQSQKISHSVEGHLSTQQKPNTYLYLINHLQILTIFVYVVFLNSFQSCSLMYK